MAKARFFIAKKLLADSGSYQPGKVLGTPKGYRDVAFAEHDLPRLADRAKVGTGSLGIFHAITRQLVQ